MSTKFSKVKNENIYLNKILMKTYTLGKTRLPSENKVLCVTNKEGCMLSVQGKETKL